MESEKIIKKYGWNRGRKIQYFASNLIFYNDYDEQRELMRINMIVLIIRKE